MEQGRTTIRERVNITVQRETLNLIDRLTKRGNRSRFIEQAVKFYASTKSRANLKKLLKEGAIQRAEEDLKIAEAWFPLEEEAWREERV